MDLQDEKRYMRLAKKTSHPDLSRVKKRYGAQTAMNMLNLVTKAQRMTSMDEMIRRQKSSARRGMRPI